MQFQADCLMTDENQPKNQIVLENKILVDQNKLENNKHFEFELKTEEERKWPNKIAAWSILILTALTLTALGSFWWTYAPTLAQNEQKIPQLNISANFVKMVELSANYQPPQPQQITLNTLFFGDVFWGRYIHEWSQESDLKEAYPFSRLDTFEREKYDAWIGSLNCPITPEERSAAEQEALLKFNCKPEYLPEAAKWFNAFSLANSHTKDMEEVDGFAQTRDRLTEQNIQYFSHHDKQVKDEICEVLSFPARVNFGEQTVPELIKNKKYFAPIALCGFHNTFALPTDSQLAQITKYSEYFPTLVYAIQGSEYNIRADGLQRQYFREMIDRGGDAIIGKGAHVVQNSEAYKGKLIVYSMGNFIYDQQFAPDVRQGVAINVKITFAYNENLENWQQIAQTCQEFQDNCLTKAQDLELKKPEFILEYNFYPTDNTGQLAKKGDDSVRQKMAQRLDWETTMAGLN